VGGAGLGESRATVVENPTGEGGWHPKLGGGVVREAVVTPDGHKGGVGGSAGGGTTV
jgi:hypothetical protein